MRWANIRLLDPDTYLQCNANDQAFRVPWPGRKQIVFLPSGWIDEMSTKKESELSKLSSGKKDHDAVCTAGHGSIKLTIFQYKR